MSVRIAAVMTCHNRRAKTLTCLSTLAEQQDHDSVVDTYVVDDGSTDGTSAAVAAAFPDVTIIPGDGGLYWAPGMRRGLDVAQRHHDYDYYLWLNDDTVLRPHALATLLQTSRALSGSSTAPAIVIGACHDPDTGALTYGGRERPSPLRRHHFRLVPPVDVPTSVETMNGNVVLVPRAVVELIGHIDDTFRHSFADEDYGLRAWAGGASVWVAPGTLATCARNPGPSYGTKTLVEELRGLTATTWPGLDPHDWATLMRRWAGPLWPAYWLSPYVRRSLRVLGVHVRAAFKGGAPG